MAPLGGLSGSAGPVFLHFRGAQPLLKDPLVPPVTAAEREPPMQPSEDKNEQPSFTAAIRWRGPAPDVQLETRHPGFRDADAACDFAGGGASNSPQVLRLGKGRVDLLIDQNYVNFPYDLTIAWMRPSDGKRAFASHPFRDLADRPDAHGEYKRVGYAVLGPDGSPVRMVIDFDNADRLSISVEDKCSPVSPPCLTIRARIAGRDAPTTSSIPRPAGHARRAN